MSISLFLIVVTCIFSFLAFRKPDIMLRMRFNAYEINYRKSYYRFLSYGLVHADGLHLFVNMYVLFSFGDWVEYFYGEYFGERGTLYFIILYLGALFTSVIPAYEKHKHHAYYNAVGASGAISAIVFASILIDPLAPMSILFLPFHFPAVVFGVAYLVYSYYMAKKGDSNIGHDAHFFGALFGIMFTILLNKNIAINFFHQLVDWFSR